jgi:ATP-binding cassette subfamily B protein
MTFKIIKHYLKTHIAIVIAILVVIVCTVGLSIFQPLFLGYIVDEVITGKRKDTLLMISIIYLGIYILIEVINFWKNYLLIIASQGISKDVRCKMMKHIHMMNHQNFSINDSGYYEAFFSNDVDCINTLITSGAISISIDLFKIIGILISIFILSLYLGIISIAIIPIVMVITLVVRKLMFKAQLRNKQLEGDVNSKVLEGISNLKTIQVYHQEKYLLDYYSDTIESHYTTTKNANFYDSIFAPIMQALRTIIIVIVVIVASYFNDTILIKVGILVSFIELLFNLFSPIESLGMELQTIQNSLAGIKRINQFFELPVDYKQNIKVPNSPDVTIELKNVSFAYEKGQDVIRNFNLTLHNNAKLVLKGSSGVGKSTITKLVYGLVKPTQGSVLINGVNSFDIDDDSKVSLFQVFYQEPYFNGGSIFQELTLNRNDISKDKVIDILKYLNLDSCIPNLDKIINTNEYSSGELVLLNLARILLSDAKVIVLDEFNAKIDHQTALKMIAILEEFSKDKILISINHFGESFKNAITITL